MNRDLMKRIVLKRLIFVIAISVMATLPALADEWSKTYTIGGKPDLRVETSDANIRVTTWDQNTIEARVITERYKIGEDGIQIEEHQSGDSVEIEVRYPRHEFNIGWKNHRVDVIVQMPREGKVTLHTGDGSIDLAGFKGEMDLHSGDGSEELNSIDGKLRATTGDGHIRANGRFDELEVKTGDGHLDVRAAAGSSLSNNWRLETGDGNVSLEVPGDLAADLDLHTGDGHIDLDLPVTTDGKVRGGEIHGKINGGGSLITIKSGDGSIHLRKS
jgi:DUF4097 and DUF4098 domain-containing protein YvlB